MSGLDVIVDTNIFISARNPHESGNQACRKLLDRIDTGEFRATLSTITIAELRTVMSPQELRTVWKPMMSHLHTSPNCRVEPVDSEIAETAGELRSSSRLTLPDALVVATGVLRGATFLLTQDTKLARGQTLLPVRSPAGLD